MPSFADDLHRDHFVVVAQRDAADAVGGPSHRPHIGLVEADRHPVARAEEDLFLAVGHLDGDDRVPLVDPHRDDAAGAGIAERRQVGLLDDALAAAHHDELLIVLGSGNSLTARSAAIFSPSSIATRFAIAFPLPPGPTSGISWTFSQ